MNTHKSIGLIGTTVIRLAAAIAVCCSGFPASAQQISLRATSPVENGSSLFLSPTIYPPNERIGKYAHEASPNTGGPLNIRGFMSVRKVGPTGPIVTGSTVRWTIDYVNFGKVNVTVFQISDIIRERLAFAAGSNQITYVSPGSVAARNSSYDGIGDDSTSALLASSATLAAGGRIQVTMDTVVSEPPPFLTYLYRNQSSATGTLLTSPILSDNIDETSIDPAGPGTTPLVGSVFQPQNPLSIDPTVFTVPIGGLFEGQIAGRSVTANGRGIKGARISLHTASGVVKTAVTNAFGYYTLFGLTIGLTYEVRCGHKRYDFANSPLLITPGSEFVTAPSFIGTLH